MDDLHVYALGAAHLGVDFDFVPIGELGADIAVETADFDREAGSYRAAPPEGLYPFGSEYRSEDQQKHRQEPHSFSA